MSKVLIADGQPSTVRTLSRVLKGEDFEVASAKSGYELERKLKKDKFDLLLMDVHLPGRNGTRAIEMVRAAAGNIPVVMLVSEAAESLAAAKEAMDFVMKPFSVEDLLARVRRAIAASRATPSVEIPQRELHDDASGRIDASQVAKFLDVPLAKLADALGANYAAVHKTPAAPALQEKLRPIKETIDLVSRITQNQSDARAWLNNPHPRLSGKAPMELILTGYAAAVSTLLYNAFQGIPS
jgi:CheY-like chemotaxis protein